MSFICRKCGPTRNLEKQYKIPTKIRNVEYHIQVKTNYADKEVIKTIKRTSGNEIVEESSYCKKHLPKENNPQVVDKIVRN